MATFGDSFDSLARQAEDRRRTSAAQLEGALNRFVTVGLQGRREAAEEKRLEALDRRSEDQAKSERNKFEIQRRDRLFSDVFNAARQGQLGEQELAPFLGQFDPQQQQALSAAQQAARAQRVQAAQEQAAVATALNQALIEPFEQNVSTARRELLNAAQPAEERGFFQNVFAPFLPKSVEDRLGFPPTEADLSEQRQALRQQALLASDELRGAQRQAAIDVLTDPRLSRQVVPQQGQFVARSEAGRTPLNIDTRQEFLPELPEGVAATPVPSLPFASPIVQGAQGGIPARAAFPRGRPPSTGETSPTGLAGLFVNTQASRPPELDTSPFFDTSGAAVTFEVDGLAEPLQRSDVAFFDRAQTQIAAELVGRGVPVEDAIAQAAETARSRLANIIRVEKENGTR